MAEIYKRYFRVTHGPMIDKLAELMAARQVALQAFKTFSDEIGGVLHTWSDGRIAGFEFVATPDPLVWRKENKHGLRWPLKTTTAGKAMWKRINALPRSVDVHEALKVVGLRPRLPVLLSQGMGYSCVLWGSLDQGKFFVKVPWEDVDPSELEAYREQHALGLRSSVRLSHLLWQPTPEMEEIPEWQALKETEELKA